MRKFFILASLLLAATAIAAPVSPEKALANARQFLNERHEGVTLNSQPVNIRQRFMASSQAQPNFYIFNTNANKGFVIVSGDDRTTSVLGYSDKGNFDPANIPVNMKEMLEFYNEQITMLDQLGLTAEDLMAPRPTRNSISPMITSHWDQGAPYWD